MKRKILSIFVMILAVLWLGVIFFMSSQTAVDSAQMSKKVTKVAIILGEKVGFIEDGASNSEEILSEYNLDIRKLAHVIMYFLFACVIFCALWGLRVNKKVSVIISFSVSICIAIIDEINQMNFIGRNSGVVSEGINDIYRDTFGIGMALAMLLITRRIKEARSKKVQ